MSKVFVVMKHISNWRIWMAVRKKGGDFKLNKNLLTKQSENDYIFTGCQIINRGIINEGDWDRPAYNFSISNIWNSSIESGDLFGFESKNNFKHVTNLEIYQKLLENN